jgi:hypothetical protein
MCNYFIVFLWEVDANFRSSSIDVICCHVTAELALSGGETETAGSVLYLWTVCRKLGFLDRAL